MGTKRERPENRYWDADNTPPLESPDEFEQLIGEKVDPNLIYEYDGSANVVKVYKTEPLRFRFLWALGEFVLTFGLGAIVVFSVAPAMERLFLWPNIGCDFVILWLLVLIPLLVMAEKIKRRLIKPELLYEIQVDGKKAKQCRKSKRIAVITAAVIVVAITMFFTISSSYSLTYLRFLADGGYGNATAVHGEINESLRFDDNTTEIAGNINGMPGDMGRIRLYLKVDKCPGAVSVYINGEKADIRESDYMRLSSYFYDESYFKNVIWANVEFQVLKINTLEIKAGDFQKEWTFKTEVAEQ